MSLVNLTHLMETVSQMASLGGRSSVAEIAGVNMMPLEHAYESHTSVAQRDSHGTVGVDQGVAQQLQLLEKKMAEFEQQMQVQ